MTKVNTGCVFYVYKFTFPCPQVSTKYEYVYFMGSKLKLAHTWYEKLGFRATPNSLIDSASVGKGIKKVNLNDG